MNSTTINISSPAGSHTVFVQYDANNERTINASVDGKEQVLYDCSANSDGTMLAFVTDIHLPFWTFRGDKGTLAVDLTTGTVALDIAKAGIHYPGVIGPGEAAAMAALVKGRGLPDLSA